MELTEYINHPERLDRSTLYELRSMLAVHPYFQTARLLMLQNLYLLHDASFDEELRRAALYLTDRKTVFNMIEAAHYQLRQQQQEPPAVKGENRTVALIDSFLDSIPPEEEQEEEGRKKRRPTPADAAVDYVAYLLEIEGNSSDGHPEETPQMKGQDLIDTFLEQEQGRILLGDLTAAPPSPEESDDDSGTEEEYFTETLARIYIKQGRYQKAHDIIGRLSEQHPQKNAYFADQLRFLEKLIINSHKQKN